jgi:hypothetical protein
MNTSRVLELLRELHTLELMAHYLASFTCRHDTREAWSHVLTAIDDRIALLRGVLMLDADAAVVQACEIALALESLAADDDAIEAIDFKDVVKTVTPHPCVTIH